MGGWVGGEEGGGSNAVLWVFYGWVEEEEEEGNEWGVRRPLAPKRTCRWCGWRWHYSSVERRWVGGLNEVLWAMGGWVGGLTHYLPSRYDK